MPGKVSKFTKRSKEPAHKQAYPWPIVPGSGLGPIRFGLSREEVAKMMGESGDLSFFEDGDFHLNYDHLGVFFFFPSDDNGKLTGIEVDRGFSCTLWGRDVWHLGRKGILRQLRAAHGHCESNQEELVVEIEDALQVSVRDPSNAVTFYFDRSVILQSINWGVIVGPDDEIVWPSLTREDFPNTN